MRGNIEEQTRSKGTGYRLEIGNGKACIFSVGLHCPDQTIPKRRICCIPISFGTRQHKVHGFQATCRILLEPLFQDRLDIAFGLREPFRGHEVWERHPGEGDLTFHRADGVIAFAE